MKGLKCLLVSFTVLVCAGTGYAKQPGQNRGLLSKPLRMAVESYDVTMDANNIEMFVTNSGVFAYDKGKSRGIYDGLYFPKGTNKTIIYDAGLWVGGKVDGDLRIAIGSYAQEWQPGTMKTPFTGSWETSYNDPKDPRFRVYKIRWDSHLELTRDAFATDAEYEAYQKARQDYLSWPVEDGAPVDAEGKPLLLGDMTLWCVFNDAEPTIHVDSAGLTDPLGIEVQMTTFAFKRTGPLGNIIFMKYRLVNKGPNTIDSTFVSLWADPDLGGAGDDLVGSDTELSLGYCYNATNKDTKYGAMPPAVGFDILRGPIGDDGVALPMTSFNKYINGTDPRNKDHAWNYMRGLDAVQGGGSPYTDPMTGQVTTYAMSGDPVAGTGWLDENASDRRFMLSSGPFNMAPGDTQEVIVGIIVGQGMDRLTSVTAMKSYDTYAQSAFDRDFATPNGPKSPVVTIAPMDSEIILTWGSDSEEEPGDYPFEGYNVYQGRTAIGPWKRIATYDVNNGVGIIFDNQFDEATGLVINTPVHYGSDSGLRRFIRITEDKWRGGSLQNGMNYYFAVTAYGYDPTAAPKTLESPINVLGREIVDPATGKTKSVAGVIPQAAGAEVAYDTTRVFGYEFPVIHVGISDGRVVPLVADPTQLTGHDYKVVFRDVMQWDPDVEDSVSVTVWDLVDVTTNTTLLADQTNQSGDDTYPIVDGLQVKVTGPSLAVKSWDYSDTRWFSWADAGLSGFGGGVGLGHEFFGSTLTAADYRKVEIRFSSDPANWTYSKVYERPGYALRPEIGTFPGSAWDMDSDPPRRLNICFVEWVDSGHENYQWDLDNTDVGGREYLFIMNSTYDPGTAGGYDDDNWGPGADVLYAYWGRLRGDHPFLETEGTWMLYPNYVNTSNDVFEFTTTAAATLPPRYGDVSLNGIVRPYDASLVLQYSVGSIALTDDQLAVAEVSGDGSVTEYDASWILQFAAGAITSFPVGLFGVEKRIAALPASGNGALSIGKASLSDSSRMSLPIYVENALGIVSSHFVLHFNPEVLKPLKVSTTSFTEGYLMAFHPRRGEIEVALAGTEPLTGMGELVAIVFEMNAEALAESNLSLRLSNIRLNERSLGAAVSDTDTAIPERFELHQNYPNPFNSETLVRYSLPTDSYVVLRIYNIRGQLVRSLIDARTEAGYHEGIWDGKDDSGLAVSSGVYLYRLKAGTYTSTKKMLAIQ